MIKTIKEKSSAEIVVKKSRFIANVFYVETEQQAKEILKLIQKEYNDAKHNCYAYVIKEIEDDTINNIQKSSDNGEPSGTAGAPLMDLLKKQGISNTLIVVTRYFGGILLGTGGLVKAYTESASLALQKACIVDREVGNRYEILIDYEIINDFKYICNKLNIRIINTEYEECIKIQLETTKEKFNQLISKQLKDIEYKITSQNIWI